VTLERLIFHTEGDRGMDKREILTQIGRIIDDVKTGLLATVSEAGKPTMRWLTPALLRGRTGALYNITASNTDKTTHLRLHPEVQWIFQTTALDRIITVDGRVNIVENPSIRSEVLEMVGAKLEAFWKITEDERDLLVLETIIDKATYYVPMKGTKESK
jgi:pyridoxamine 5'-phosphate oxidase